MTITSTHEAWMWHTFFEVMAVSGAPQIAAYLANGLRVPGQVVPISTRFLAKSQLVEHDHPGSWMAINGAVEELQAATSAEEFDHLRGLALALVPADPERHAQIRSYFALLFLSHTERSAFLSADTREKVLREVERWHELIDELGLRSYQLPDVLTITWRNHVEFAIDDEAWRRIVAHVRQSGENKALRQKLMEHEAGLGQVPPKYRAKFAELE